MATTMHGRDPGDVEFDGNQNRTNESFFDSQVESAENDLRLLAACQREYYKGRKISIKNIPATTKEEVDLFLGEYRLKEIFINEEEKEAEVTLECGEDAEDIVKERNQSKMLDHVISVSILPSDNIMCVAHLPENFEEADFTALVSQYGPVSKSYMLRAEDTGKNKGYGFVEYFLRFEKHKQIRATLDWKEIQGHKIHCDILDTTTAASFSNLHSKCLLIDNLPKDYKDNVNFREIFSRYVSPIYCQIVMKEGDPLGYGIVEYAEGLEAEQSQRSINGYLINGVPIRVTFCVPGKPAVAICTRLLTKLEQSAASMKPSLLPDPISPSPVVINHQLIKDLCMQYPNLMLNFKTALLQLQQTYVSQMNAKSTKPGLLGPAPSVNLNPLVNPNMQLGLVILLALQMQAKSNNQSIGSTNLLTLIGQRFTSQMSNDKPSLLGDPVTAQANIILQNLMSQVPSGGSTADATDSETGSPLLQSVALNIQNLNLNWLTSLGQLTNSMHESSIQTNIQSNNNSKYGQRNMGNQGLFGQMPLMGDRPGSDVGLQNPGGRGFSNNGPTNNRDRMANIGGRGPALPGEGLLGAMPSKPPGNESSASQAFFKNLQMFASSKGKRNELTSLLDKIPVNQVGKTGTSLLGDPPAGIMQKWKSLKDKLENGPAYVGQDPQRGGSLLPRPDMPPVEPYKESQPPRQYGGYSNQSYDEYNKFYDEPSFSKNDSRDDSAYGSFNKGRGSTSSMHDYDHYPYSNANVSQNTSSYSRSSSVSSQGGYDQEYNSYSQYKEPPVREPDRYQNMAAKAMAYAANSSNLGSNYSSNYGSNYSSNYGNNNSGYGNYSKFSTPVSAARQSSYLQSSGQQSQPSRSSQRLPSYSSKPGALSPVSSGSTPLLKTPVGQKRSYSSLLPPPEPSPESDYVGQHSQGIGGHYADNYAFKRQKLDHGSLMSRFSDF